MHNEKWYSGIRDSGNETYLSTSRTLQLQFVGRPSLPILTGKNITGENNTPIGIVLYDVRTAQVVDSGPEASANVEIVVLEKDFNGHDWSPEEFNSNIIWKREGGKTLLVGDIHVNLKEGIGSIGDIHFSHTKWWMKKIEFRLGARTVDCALGHKVREAKTEPFFVKDRRLELCKKNHPPALSDAVWRLEKINRDGAFHDRLSKENINTVKDFMTRLYMDPLGLKQILGTGMSTAMWDVTVNHAQTCIPDPRLYVYCPGSQQKTCVVFSIVGQVMGLLSECQYTRLDKLSKTEKGDAHNMVIAAFKNWEKVVSVDDEASLLTNASAHFFSDVLRANSADIKVLTSQEVGGFDCPQAIYQRRDPCMGGLSLKAYADRVVLSKKHMTVSFSNCDYSAVIWSHFLQANGVLRGGFTYEMRWLGCVSIVTVPAFKNSVLKLSLAAVVYRLWRERNRRVFKRQSFNHRDLIIKIAVDLTCEGVISSQYQLWKHSPINKEQYVNSTFQHQ